MHPIFKAVAIGVAFSASAAFAQSATYVLDTMHTVSRFSYNHLGLSTQSHRFDKTAGTVVFDKAAKTGSVDVVIDMTSVNVGSTVFNGHLQSEGFFDTAKFPTATFKSTKLTFDGDKLASVEGNLTIKDVTKPVTLKVTHFVSTTHPMNKMEVIGAEATVTIKRAEFNVSKFVPAAADVTITVALEAVKQ